jgi:excisionase family DNA binding protein
METQQNTVDKKKSIEDYDDFMTAKEMMDVLKIGQNKAYELLRSGEIESFMIGTRNKRVIKKSVISYIEKNKAKGAV